MCIYVASSGGELPLQALPVPALDLYIMDLYARLYDLSDCLECPSSHDENLGERALLTQDTFGAQSLGAELTEDLPSFEAEAAFKFAQPQGVTR